MQRIGGFLAVGAVALAASGCATMLPVVSVNPGCSAMQAYAYHNTSQFTVRQHVNAIQARYNASARYAGPIRESQGWTSLASGECR